ncbi:MAG: hypothetical protein A3H97_20520 [Acidobacteria bacterium RIFCSPLOWO2_02_FULL_65_29]|nr:MAG: hypothetical protein A3H97_20520 [Acidobacteria bacterium RIFCSPLOWO2_02_FULL_65_29]
MTLVFGALSILFYFRAKRFKQLAIVYSTTQLQTRAHPEVEISFRGEPVENLSRLRVVCWNSGTEAIRSSDLPENDLPRVTFDPPTRILSVAAPASSDHSRFAIKQSGTAVQISFVYLNPGDFGLFEILYENLQPKDRSARFVAPVIGAVPRRVEMFARPLNRLEFGFLVVAPALVAILGAFAAYTAFGLPDWTTPKAVGGFLQAVAGLLLGGIGVRANVSNRRHQRLPAVAQTFLGDDSRPNALEPTASVTT